MDIITAQDADYENYRHVYTARGNPSTVFLPNTAQEVSFALSTARADGRPFAIRSGGHGISSVSTNDGGLVIDLRRLNSVVRLGPQTVAVGPGARWEQVARSLHPWGLALSSGDSGDVGVGGLATTGGIGLLGRAHGLTIDHLRAAEVVTADGTIRHIDADQDPDLFWAVRGAGANVGIVTSFVFDARPVPGVVQATLFFGIQDAAGFLHTWGEIVEAAPRELSAFLYIAAGDAVQAQATIVVADTDEEAGRQMLGPFLSMPGLVQQIVRSTPYFEALVTTGEPHAGQQTAKSHNGLIDHLSGDLSGALAQHLKEPAIDVVMIRSVGGAINDLAASATAYAHRHQNFSVMSVSMTGGNAFDLAWNPIHERMDGMYLSFETGHLDRHVTEAFPPETLARLREIKRRWDPDGVFNQNFNVAV